MPWDLFIPHLRVNSAWINEQGMSLTFATYPSCLRHLALQMVILGLSIQGLNTIIWGVGLAILGLAFFNFGLLYGLMPIGEEF
jgi:hypothetical protein